MKGIENGEVAFAGNAERLRRAERSKALDKQLASTARIDRICLSAHAERNPELRPETAPGRGGAKPRNIFN